MTIESSILTHVQGYIKKYDILSEGRSGEWYKTHIRALVSTQQIHDDLDTVGLLRTPAVGNPRVAILLQEWVGDQRSPAGDAIRALSQGLLGHGFQVVTL